MVDILTTKVYTETLRDTEGVDLVPTKIYAEVLRGTEKIDLYPTKIYAEVLRIANDVDYITSDSYTTDFSEYTDAEIPSDWNDEWSGDISYDVTQYEQLAPDYTIGGKLLNFVTNSTAKSALCWTDIPEVYSTIIIASVRVPTSSHQGRILTRVSGSSGSENCYFVSFGTNIQIAKYVNGTASILASCPFAIPTNSAFYIKFYCVGTDLKVKLWSKDAFEPNDWLLETTDTDLSSGLVGIGGNSTSDYYYCDYFSCGTDGEEPIFPPESISPAVDKFGYAGLANLVSTDTNVCYCIGGQFINDEKVLTGLNLTHGNEGLTTTIRAAVYSGGSLTDPNGATLLHDFGEISVPAAVLFTESCTPVLIPVDTPVWLVIKFATFDFKYSPNGYIGNAGNWQNARGYCDLTSDLGYDTTVAFSSTLSVSSPTFSDYWFDWDLIIDSSYAQTPVLNPLTGSYPDGTTVSITCGTSGATIYYTTNGVDPTSGDSEYTTPMTITNGMNIKAIAIASGYNDSAVASETYYINEVQPLVFIIT